MMIVAEWTSNWLQDGEYNYFYSSRINSTRSNSNTTPVPFYDYPAVILL